MAATYLPVITFGILQIAPSPVITANAQNASPYIGIPELCYGLLLTFGLVCAGFGIAWGLRGEEELLFRSARIIRLAQIPLVILALVFFSVADFSILSKSASRISYLAYGYPITLAAFIFVFIPGVIFSLAYLILYAKRTGRGNWFKAINGILQFILIADSLDFIYLMIKRGRTTDTSPNANETDPSL